MIEPPRHLMEPDPDADFDLWLGIKVFLWTIVFILAMVLLLNAVISHG